jgi:hypothetical protein
MAVKRRIVGAVLAAFCLGFSGREASAASITTSGHQLLVDGSPLVVRGVNYSPTPNTGVRAAGGGDFTAFPAVCEADFAKMQEMGANTLRVYVSYEALFNNFNNHDPTADAVVPAALARYGQVLASAQSHGLWVVMNYWLPQNVNYTQGQPRLWQQLRFRKIVHTFKDAAVYPNVLMWAFGNENNLSSHLAGMTSTDLFSFYEETIGGTQTAEDVTHPYTAVLVDNGDIFNASLAGLAPSVDIWSMTLYQTAAGYERVLRTYTQPKPLLFMEFGQDAYSGGESPATQAAFYGDRWGNHIAPHLSSRDPVQVLLGGCLFEWNDEWWKAGGPTTHDPGGAAGNDDADGLLNEEWFGLSTALPEGAAAPRSYREAFDVLKALWTASPGPTVQPPDGGPRAADGGGIGGGGDAANTAAGGGAGNMEAAGVGGTGIGGASSGAAGAGQAGADAEGSGGATPGTGAAATTAGTGSCACAIGRGSTGQGPARLEACAMAAALAISIGLRIRRPRRAIARARPAV